MYVFFGKKLCKIRKNRFLADMNTLSHIVPKKKKNYIKCQCQNKKYWNIYYNTF